MDFRHSGVSVTQTQRVKLLGLARDTNTDSQATGSGLSHQHRESKHWVWPILQRVKALRLAYQTNVVNQPDTGLDLSYKHRESKHWVWPVTQTQRVKALGLACHTNTVKALGLAFHTNAANQLDTGLDLSCKHTVEAPGRPCHTSVDYVNCQ